MQGRVADQRSDAVQDPRAGDGTHRRGTDHDGDRTPAIRLGNEARERQDDLGGNRREDVLHDDEQRDAERSQRVDDVGDPAGEVAQHRRCLVSRVSRG